MSAQHQHDAFGRPIATSDDSSSAPIGRPASGRGQPPRPRAPRTPVWRWPFLLVLLTAGTTGIAFGLSSGVLWADDEPTTHEFALQRDPFGPRSLLRPERLLPAIEIVLFEAKAHERVAALEARPSRVTLTLTSPQYNESRRVTVNTVDDVESTDLDASASLATVPVGRATDVAPQPPARALYRLWAAQQPDARNPSLSALIDGDGERIVGWRGDIEGVSDGNDSVRTDETGKVVR